MNTTYDLKTADHRAIVYVRPVKVDELPEEARRQAEGLDTIYAVHNSVGDQLALVRDRELAYVLARQNDMTPVAVH